MTTYAVKGRGQVCVCGNSIGAAQPSRYGPKQRGVAPQGNAATALIRYREGRQMYLIDVSGIIRKTI